MALAQLDIASLRRLAGERDADGRPVLRPEDIEYVEAVHDEEIAYTDASIGKLMEGVRSLGSGRPTVVFLTADHGEFFMERGDFGHDQAVVYQALVHVPERKPPILLPAKPGDFGQGILVLMRLYP